MKDTASIRQCEANIRAVFNLYSLPWMPVLANLSDRILFAETLLFLDAVKRKVPREFETWDFVHNHGVTAMQGWRERTIGPSMQIVRHRTAIIEIDFDHYNPGFGLLPAFLHFLECVHPAKTDPFAIADGLRKRRGITVIDFQKASLT